MCVLDITHDKSTIYSVKGNKLNSYTKGVICSKVSRYSERTHNLKRLTYPLLRIGKKGDGKFKRISWNNALEIVRQKITFNF